MTAVCMALHGVKRKWPNLTNSQKIGSFGTNQTICHTIILCNLLAGLLHNLNHKTIYTTDAHKLDK